MYETHPTRSLIKRLLMACNRDLRTAENPLAEFLLLATAPPDLDLLARYAADMLPDSSHEAVTLAERKWVETNLAVNPVWQKAWGAMQTRPEAPVRRHFRRLVLASTVVGLLAAGWMETLEVVDVSTGASSEEVLRGTEKHSYESHAKRQSVEAGYVLDGAWSLRPTVSRGVPDVVRSRLESMYNHSENPVVMGEAAFRLGRLFELTGEYRLALGWYRLGLENGSGQYREYSSVGAKRMARRTRFSYESNRTYGAQ